MKRDRPAMDGPDVALKGVRVADFSRVLAGPYASMMLGDLGADVIKIESPSGDDTRHWQPPVDAVGQSTYFSSVNRNKRSVVCDLRSRNGFEFARRLVMGADVVIENFRPGVMESLGFDFADMRSENPGLIWCSISGFGRGAGAGLPGYDLLVQASGGLMSITGSANSGPTKVGVALVDVLAGSNALAGILAALRVRDSTGVGQRVNIDLLSSLLTGLVNQASSTIATGVSPGRLGNAHPSIAPYESYAARDREIVIAVGTDRQFRSLAEVLGKPELADDALFLTNRDRVHNRAELQVQLEARLCTRPARAWVSLLTDANVPAGLVNSISEAFELAERLGLDRVIVCDDGAGGVNRQVANPITLSETPVGYRLPPPTLGQHPNAAWLPRAQEERSR
jgi:crotonobetainyl-CoA:carnitine CoA-transferase CaiB-like acyl-CoA transferase